MATPSKKISRRKKTLKSFQVDSHRTPYPHVYLFNAAHYALERAERSDQGSMYECMTTNLFSALSLEAFLNVIGTEKISWWAGVERKLGPREKLTILSAELNFVIDWAKRPYQTVASLLRLRDFLAHAKTETVNLSEVRQDELVRFDEPNWEKLCCPPFARRALDDTKAVLEQLHKAAGRRQSSALTTLSFGGYRKKPM